MAYARSSIPDIWMPRATFCIESMCEVEKRQMRHGEKKSKEHVLCEKLEHTVEGFKKTPMVFAHNS